MLCWLAGPDGKPLDRPGVGMPEMDGAEAVVEAAKGSAAQEGAELRFRPGRRETGGWDLDGDPSALGLERSNGAHESATHPDALARVWSALTAAHAGDVLVSLAPGYETVDWGGMTHAGGGSHGSLLAEDSLVPLLTVGVEGADLGAREQWRIADVADLVLGHFGALVPS